MMKPKVTLVTCANMPHLYSNETGLLDALSDRGVDPRIAVWDDPSEDWSSSRVNVVRSVTDYARDRGAFLDWARSVPRLVNPYSVLEWNTDKHYMIELEKRGLPTIPTTWLEPEQHLTKQQVHSRFPASGDFVIKPAVSSGVRDVGRYSANDTLQRQAAIVQTMSLLEDGRSVMIQRYQTQIDTLGETSLIFFNGLVSHSVEKRGMLDVEATPDSRMHESAVVGQDASAEKWQWGEEIRQIVHSYVRDVTGHDELFLYNRVDLIPDGEGSFKVMEISLVDADLYLSSAPHALDAFAEAIVARAFW